ncbi:MAG: hypothetical protein HYS05_06230 [Acidobacteria bacterium]|nr:hypothetical protein [Acidobacteriota bacterium]
MALLPLRRAARRSHEAVFSAHYASLVRWALHLRRHDRHGAEDLVHDAFVQFTLGQPDLEAIGDVEGYLHGMVLAAALSRSVRLWDFVVTSTRVPERR